MSALARFAGSSRTSREDREVRVADLTGFLPSGAPRRFGLGFRLGGNLGGNAQRSRHIFNKAFLEALAEDFRKGGRQGHRKGAEEPTRDLKENLRHLEPQGDEGRDRRWGQGDARLAIGAGFSAPQGHGLSAASEEGKASREQSGKRRLAVA